MTAPIQKLTYALLGAFTAVALALGYWNIAEGSMLLARSDNPRRVLDELRIRRGEILDRNGTVIAGSTLDPETDFLTRTYVYPEAAPAVGYYSQRYGTAGIEAAFDELLRGDNPSQSALTQLQRHLLHQPPVGGDVQLTLDIGLQQAAMAALGDHTGAVVMIGVPSGEVLVIASTPTFDPNTLTDEWDTLRDDPAAPLLNRATQGRYQPGTTLQSVLLGGALNVRATSLDRRVTGQLASTVEQSELPCAMADADVDTLAEAYQAACPEPFVSVVDRIGVERLEAVLGDYGLLEAPAFTLPTEATNEAWYTTDTDIALTAIGQSDLVVSPLQMALVAASFAQGGQVPAPRLVLATRQPGAGWVAQPAQGHPYGTISPANASTVADLMRLSVEQGAAGAARSEDVPVHGHAGLALSSEGTYNGWFTGFVETGSDSAVAIAVLLEDVRSAAEAARIGGDMLQAGLAIQQ